MRGVNFPSAVSPAAQNTSTPINTAMTDALRRDIRFSSTFIPWHISGVTGIAVEVAVDCLKEVDVRDEQQHDLNEVNQPESPKVHYE